MENQRELTRRITALEKKVAAQPMVIADAVAGCNQVMRKEYLDRLAAMDLRLSHAVYKGVWDEGFYYKGSSVTHDGSLWMAKTDTESRPGGPSRDWQLCAKGGQRPRIKKPEAKSL